MNRHFTLSKALMAILLFLGIALGQSAFAQTTWTVENISGSTFTISRSGEIADAVTVNYRTVSLSAIEGWNFSAANGTITFGANEPSRTVTVRENNSNNDVFMFQNGNSRSYRFEVLDQGGFELAHCDRSYTTGTSVPSSGIFQTKDVTIQTAEYAADDAGYENNGYKSVSSSNYFDNLAPQTYLQAIGAELRMTLSLQAKEEDDAYEYLQILFDNTSTCDNRSGANNGDPGTPARSIYMAGFEMNSGSTDATYRNYSFPVTSAGNNASATNPWGHGTNWPLTMQRFNTMTSMNFRASDGRLVLPTNFNTLVLRLNASGGSGSDRWWAKNVVAHIQAVDEHNPALFNGTAAITVSGGRHSNGNTFYISVPFDEIVHISGAYKQLYTSWGTMEYLSGDHTNVITFIGTINAAPGTVLSITGIHNCLFNDLANNYYQGNDDSFNKTFNGVTVDASYNYPISYTLNNGVLPSGYPTTYTYDAATSIMTPTRSSYDFVGWTGSNGNTPQTNVSIAAHSHGAKSYTAHWTPTTYNLTYDLAGGSVTTTNPTTYNIETATFTLNNPTRTGYTFAGWTGTDLDEPTINVTIAQGSIGDRTYTATWNTITYSIAYDLAGGSVTTTNPTTYNIETATFTLNNPTREGYTFAGWMGTDLNEPTMNVTIAQGSIGDRSYTATWNTITYTITYNLDGGSVATANPETYNIETATFTLNNPTREGYTFAGWTGTDLDETTINVTIAQGSIGDRSFTANWTPITYNITYDLAGGTVATANPTTYNIETATFTLNNPTREHYTFAGWTGTDLDEPTMNVTITQGSIGDRSYTANWTPITYNIAYDLAGGSVATANPTTYNIETATFTLNNPTREGYTFVGWTGTDLTEPTQTVTIAQGSIGDRTYTANWTLITYNITYDLAGGSVTTANPTTYHIETATFTLNNPTREGYIFAGWTGTDLNEPTMNVTIAQGSIGDRSYTATWNTITYTITYNLDGGSVATANPETYNIETATFTLNNPTREGYTFAGWTGTDLTEPTQTVTIAQGSIGDRTYTANWTLITYNITYDLAGGSVTTANPTTYHIETATFTLNNPTRTGYTFAGWTGTDLDEPTMTVTIAQGSTGDRSYTATWSTDAYTITYDLAGGSVTTANPTTYNIETATFTLNNPTRPYFDFAGWAGTDLDEPTMNVTIAQGSTGDRSYTATWTLDIAGSWGDGNDGSAEHPYLITTPAELDLLATIVNSNEPFNGTYFELGNDIAYTHTSDWDDTNSTENNYTSIGGRNGTVFKGVFDGKGYTISGIRINSTSDIQGLFGMIKDGAVVKNITLTDARIIASGNFHGGIVGYTHSDGIVDNCHVTSTVNIHNPTLNVGGIVGYVSGIVRGCTSSAKLTIDEKYHFNYGGIAGSNAGGTIENCLAINVINECTNTSGPIVGSNNGTVTNSYYRNCTVGGESNMSNAYTLSPANNITLSVNDYDLGIEYGGTLYAPENAVLSLNLGFTGNPQDFIGYMASAGTLTGNENPYSLTMPGEDVNISARMNIPYIDANGQTAYCQYYTILNGSTDYSSYGEDGVEAWYVVDHDVTYTDDVSFYGSANLILVDGATLTLNPGNSGPGITMSTSNNFNIYVQSAGNGAITATDANIGADDNLTIYGGHISLTSVAFDACYLFSYDDLTINGGQISIVSNENCILTYNGLLTINGGTLNAVTTEENNSSGYGIVNCGYDGDVFINGGNITLTNDGDGHGINASDVTINGGNVSIHVKNSSSRYGINVGGTITLGWTDASDRIMSQGGYNADQLNIATGQAFTDGEGNYYFGTYSRDEMSDLAGKTLVPFTNLSETFNITYVTDGGTLPDGYPTTYTFGETVVLPVPTKEDNTFVGWFENSFFYSDPVTEITAGTSLGDRTFYAMWMPAKTWVDYLDADGQQQRVYATVLYGIETELPGGVYTIVDDGVSFDKLSFTGTTTIILPDNKYLYVECMGKGTNDDEYSLFVNGDLTIYGQEHGDGAFGSYNVQVSGDVAIYGGYHDIGYLSANNGSGTITLSWTGWDSSIRVGVYLGNVVLAKAFIDDYYTIHEAGTVADVTTINGQYLYPFITETEVSYLDENGVLQTVTATVLYGGEEAEYPGGVYTVLDMVIRGQADYDRLHFTGDATIIIPDWCSLGVAATKEDNEYWMHVDGDLTIYGQEYGNGQCIFSNVTVNGNVNVYGGEVVLYNISANAINLSWTSIQNEHMVNPTQGTTVNLLKDFMYYDDDHNRHVINAQQGVDIATIATYYLKPYAETIDVSYIDENGDTHTENATVLFGDETNLDGGTYTIMNGISFSHALSFSGDTKLIVPDGTYFYGYTQDNSFFEGEVINVNVNGDLAIYGQENRSGTVLYINASVSGAVTVSNVRVIYSFINSERDILIAGGEHEYGQLSANGTITLGYLTFNDEIYCEDYEGTVAIRAGQTMIDYGTQKTYTGTLTADEVTAIKERYLEPYYTSITLDVAGYGESDGGWVLIASPIAGSIYADNVTNLIGGMTPSGQYDYDLYRFNQSAPMEWENYQQNNSHSNPFMLENGKGYLYANKYDVTLEFSGPVYSAASKEVALDYDANAPLAGWNLVGNPFTEMAYIEDGREFYTMNAEGSEIIASTSNNIEAMEGVFVIAEEDGETMQFTTQAPQAPQKGGVILNISKAPQAPQKGSVVIDRAIVRFGEGRQLPKFQLRENSTKLYIPQNGTDYAVVNMGRDVAPNVSTEILVYFKAKENGVYTLTISETFRSPFSVLRLIDHLTGADIDMLQMPNYTFEASTTDYASRFKLVFSVNEDNQNNDNFAFISNGEIIVNGTGTLQMIDLLGHVLFMGEVNSEFHIPNSVFSSGVYVLRLINGDQVKTQKIVVD